MAFEYSPAVPNTACGCPLIDLTGEVIGIAIGGPDDRNGWAIPGDSIRRLVDEAKAGRLSQWPSR